MKCFNILLGFSLLLLIASCVSPKHVAEVEKENEDCKKAREELFAKNEKLTVSNTELESKFKVSEDEIKRLKDGTQEDLNELKLLKSRYQQLDKRYKDLQEAQSSLISGSDAETRELLKKLDNTQQDLYQREDQLNQMTQKLDKDRAELTTLQRELEHKNARMFEMERILSQKDSAVDALKNKVTNALLSYEGQGLTVSKRNGKIYVSLDEKLLFQSGSSQVDSKGIAALKKLAGVLEQNKDINIMIEGHTDDVPIVGGSKYKDNWDLSVARATTIIRILTDGTGIDPKRLTAAGRGEFLPVDASKTTEARQKNRRTEIILTPNLDELFDILNAQ